jgi:AcrR family transcriptional regulator
LCHVSLSGRCFAAGYSGAANVPRTLSEEDIAEFREQLCAAASRLFAQRGTDGVTMRALAEIMGISPMKPYHYFRDKEEILAAAMERAFNRFVAALEAADKSTEPALERAAARRRAYVTFALAEPDSYRIMFELPHPDTTKYPDLQAAMDRARAITRRGMDALIASGQIEGDPSVLGHVFWCALHGAVSAYIAGKLDSREELETILDITMASLQIGLKPKAG